MSLFLGMSWVQGPVNVLILGMSWVQWPSYSLPEVYRVGLFLFLGISWVQGQVHVLISRSPGGSIRGHPTN
jgi:hypothetical protein